MKSDVEVVLAANATLGEGALWDHERGLLLWVDILAKRVNQFDPLKRTNCTLQLETLVGAVVPTGSGDLMVAVNAGFARVDRTTGQLSKLITPPGHNAATIRFNDGKCDPAGRFWAGTMSLSDQPNQGMLYCLEPGGLLRTEVSEVSISNGLAWSLDGTCMYYIDTPTRTVAAFDFEPASGAISRRRTAIEVPAQMGNPDGMTIDAEGMLWIALWDGAAVSRWDPATGRLLEQRLLPATRITSCALGGPHLDTLFITSARTGLSASELERQPLAGAIFALKSEVPGIPAFSFHG
jgi:sugar lactone lactonase YvrE